MAVDWSSGIAWAVPLFGLPLAFAVGRFRAKRASATSGAMAFGLAVVLGIALTFVQSALHTACIGSWQMCESRGDGNMSYWFQSFFAIPLFWFATWIGSQTKR